MIVQEVGPTIVKLSALGIAHSRSKLPRFRILTTSRVSARAGPASRPRPIASFMSPTSCLKHDLLRAGNLRACLCSAIDYRLSVLGDSTARQLPQRRPCRTTKEARKARLTPAPAGRTSHEVKPRRIQSQATKRFSGGKLAFMAQRRVFRRSGIAAVHSNLHW